MFFFIAGVQPRKRTIDATPRRCPRCGLNQAAVQRVDHYFSLFFVPLVPVKRGEPFLYCRHCNSVVGDGRGVEFSQISPNEKPPACRRCGRPLDPDFAYCPYCGERR
ncbi:zinc ribbon domain-containing protein [Desulfatitalea tepidiphila]|uniref:zinc ribbon domain-containing protein n=1 Tax=Desulfatitalea tepidiphila TaxID=1185843 RepID=UPI0006B64551|nr:zinc ribbon domain-containing protein [Desulfatitalea tepidiphila]